MPRPRTIHQRLSSGLNRVGGTLLLVQLSHAAVVGVVVPLFSFRNYRAMLSARSRPNIILNINKPSMIVAGLGAARTPHTTPAIATNGRTSVNGPKINVLVMLRISTERNDRIAKPIKMMPA